MMQFLRPTGKTLLYTHGLALHYTCKIIHGYLDVYKYRTANDSDKEEVAGQLCTSEDRSS